MGRRQEVVFAGAVGEAYVGREFYGLDPYDLRVYWDYVERLVQGVEAENGRSRVGATLSMLAEKPVRVGVVAYETNKWGKECVTVGDRDTGRRLVVIGLVEPVREDKLKREEVRDLVCVGLVPVAGAPLLAAVRWEDPLRGRPGSWQAVVSEYERVIHEALTGQAVLMPVGGGSGIEAEFGEFFGR